LCLRGAAEETAQHESLGFSQPTYMPLNSSD
jgi:hypothetical protein